jgi:SEC-C motif
LQDDISADLDVAMSVRRNNVPGKRTPEGILTRIANTSVGRILKEIDTRADPQTPDLGFMLLTLGENAILKISKAIDAITERTRSDGQSHDVSVPPDEAGAGLTIHCNDDPLPASGPRLLNYSTARKYTLKVDEWHGVCLWPRDGTVRFGVSLNYKWKPDAEMDRLTSNLLRLTPFEDLFSRPRRKVGRNDPCPCNSGLKYKKCHGK